MVDDLIHDRGRGPELTGTRITVYNLLPHLLDPATTEAEVCRIYELSPEQVAAARAFTLNHPETVLAEHLRIEERMAAGNPEAVIEQARRTHATFLRFKVWLVDRQRAEAREQAVGSGDTERGAIPSFREWLAGQGSPMGVSP